MVLKVTNTFTRQQWLGTDTCNKPFYYQQKLTSLYPGFLDFLLILCIIMMSHSNKLEMQWNLNYSNIEWHVCYKLIVFPQIWESMDNEESWAGIQERA